MRPPGKPRRAPVQRQECHLSGGPYHGKVIRLELNGDLRTLPIGVRGQCGHYVKRPGVAGNCLEWVPNGRG